MSKRIQSQSHHCHKALQALTAASNHIFKARMFKMTQQEFDDWQQMEIAIEQFKRVIEHKATELRHMEVK